MKQWNQSLGMDKAPWRSVRPATTGRNRALGFCAGLVLLAVISAPLCGLGQAITPGALPPNPQVEVPPAPAAQPAPVRIQRQVNLVNISFSVVDPHHQPVTGVRASDLEVLDDKRPQRISFFSVGHDVPLTVGLLLDTSPSQINVLPAEQQASERFFDEVITPKDLAFIVGFDVDTNLLQDLTSSLPALRAAIEQVHVGGGGIASPVISSGPFPSSVTHPGSTHLWDSIVMACNDRLAAQVGRKAIIVMTDGEDQGSRYTPQDALRALLDTNTSLYAFIIADPRFYNGTYTGAGALTRLAKESGGLSYGSRHLRRSFDELSQRLRTQYSLGYIPERGALDGKFHHILIRLKGNRFKKDKVQARSGYFAVPPPHGQE